MGFWKDKKVLITGHTGFKGSWLSLYLKGMGANVFGYSLAPKTVSMFSITQLNREIDGYFGNIQDFSRLETFLKKVQPDVLFHLAAQSLVSESYLDPLETIKTNVLGSSNLLMAASNVTSVKVVINVTSDKCYDNKGWGWSYSENDRLGGKDPYSASKACVEILNQSIYESYYRKKNIGLATVRSGNVIGGGDWGENRLIPDVLKAIDNNKKLIIRYPNATRPWQHVMEALSGYVSLAQRMFNDPTNFSEPFNFGPKYGNSVSVKNLIQNIYTRFNLESGYRIQSGELLDEAKFLSLDSSKAHKRLNWTPKWSIDQTCDSITEWHKAYRREEDMKAFTQKQIFQFAGS
jgi:CDP-glucose 4,6-dehydratase